MSGLNWGTYGVVGGVLYRQIGSSAADNRSWLLEAVDPTEVPRRRGVPIGTPGFQEIHPSASYRGTRVTDLLFNEDGTVDFRLWTDDPDKYASWPDGVLIEYARWGHPGDNFWRGRIPFSELEDFDDGIPGEWRPYLPQSTSASNGALSRNVAVRDARADEGYFRDVISNLAKVCADEDERAARPVDRWRAPHERGVAAGNALKPHWDLFSSLYSYGASIEDLRTAFGEVLDAAERAHELGVETLPDKIRDLRFGFGRSKDFYREWLWLVSLALAFEVDDATFARVASAVEFGWGDQLLDRLIASRRPEHPIGGKLAFPRVVGPLMDAVDTPSAADAEKLVGRYLGKWYASWKGVHGWGGHGFVGKRLYWGYWAFEALGVVKALGLDDSSFRENEYYPRDLVGR